MMQLVSDRTFMYSPGNSFKPTTIYLSVDNKEANDAMKRYTAKLKKENAKFRKQKQNCSASS